MANPGTLALYEASDGWATTSPVGSFPRGASPFGLLDMAGNVSEWTSTRNWSYDGKPGDTSARIVRGGSWMESAPTAVRAAWRERQEATTRYGYIGLRCAKGL